MADEITGLVDDLNKSINDDRKFRVALTTTLAVHKPRIFQNGQAADGSAIGTYSKATASISKKNQARQTGHTYFKGGYAQYHGEIGKGSSKVILDNFGVMKADYGLQGSNGDYGFGFQNDFNADKSVWNEDHFKKPIFQLSEQEIKLFADTLNAQL